LATAELSKKLEGAGQTQRPSTIHSFALSILMRNLGCANFPQPLRIPGTYEQLQLIEPDLAQRMRVSKKQIDRLIREMAAAWQSLAPEEDPQVSAEQRARFLGLWHQHRYIFGYTLLAELPDLLRKALRDHDDLESIGCELMIVDEYQDLNACDLEALRRLAARGQALLAIGDDDQSIYRNRKAHPVGIRRFLEDYQTDRDYPLTVCQRSPQANIRAAQHVILGDPDREPRPAPTFRPDAPPGIVHLLRFASIKREAAAVAAIADWLIHHEDVPATEILILSRTDYLGRFSKPVKAELEQRGITATDPQAIQRTLQEAGNRLLLALLQLAVNGSDSLAWWTLLKPAGGPGPQFINQMYEAARDGQTTFGQAFCDAATAGFPTLTTARRARAQAIWDRVNATRQALVLPPEARWGEFIVQQIDGGRLPACTPELRTLLLQVDPVVEEGTNLQRYLGLLEPLGKDLAQTTSPGVRCMTMGASKGLTVTATIIIGVDADLIPRMGQDVAEERRLLYVAMTRSLRYLFMTWVTKREGPQARSSRVNPGRRQPTQFLDGGPVETEDGADFITSLQRR